MQNEKPKDPGKALDDITKAFLDAFSDLTAEKLNWKPNASTWSIAQNIDHIIVINTSYFPVVKTLRAGTLKLPWWSRWNVVTDWMGNKIYQNVGPDRKRKARTFPIWEPAQSEIADNILARFEQHQEDLARFMLECSDLVASGAIIHSPASHYIVYPLSMAFDIIAQHERRHLEQAKEVKALLR